MISGVSSTEKKVKGSIYLCIIRNCSSDVCIKCLLLQTDKIDLNVTETASLQKLSFNNKENPKKGDCLAVYTPPGSATFHPLHIAVNRKRTKPYLFLKNSDEINASRSNVLEKKVKSIIESTTWNSLWKAGNDSTELNIQVEISCKPSTSTYFLITLVCSLLRWH